MIMTFAADGALQLRPLTLLNEKADSFTGGDSALDDMLNQLSPELRPPGSAPRLTVTAEHAPRILRLGGELYVTFTVPVTTEGAAAAEERSERRAYTLSRHYLAPIRLDIASATAKSAAP